MMTVHRLMKRKAFIPSSPVLMNAGLPHAMLHSCFVLPIEDDMQAIMKTLTDTVMIQKYGGGVGINFSPLRAEGTPISTTGGTASGPVSFMSMFNTAMDVVKQAGKRQGAMMGVLNATHPDIVRFCTAKAIEHRLTNFNISVGIDKEFWEAPDDTVFPGGTKRDIMDVIVAGAWLNGEPGVLFLDNINEHNPYPEPITCVNPCGEIPIPSYGACCLGSINLNAFMQPDKDFDFNFGAFFEAVHRAIQCLDRVVEKGYYVIPEIEEFERKYRPLGLGVMGLADVLAKLGYPYGSEEAHRFTATIFESMRHEAQLTSNGKNATVLSVAPTGTIAMLANASYSIEPFFSLAYTKVVNAGSFTVIDPTLKTVLATNGITLTEDEVREIIATGSIQGVTRIPEHIREVFLTANELPWETHLHMQSIVQRYVDNAVSKTINLPSSATYTDIKNIIVKAHDMGLKGLTVYRKHSREDEVIRDCASGLCTL